MEFVRKVQPLISRVVYKTLRRRTNPLPSLVDDLVQDTYLKLYANNFRALRDFKFEHDNSLFGFLKTVASRVVSDYFRKRGSDQEKEVEVEDLDTVPLAASSRSFSKNADRNILIGQIKRCLLGHASDPNYSRDCNIFWLYYQQGLTARAISEIPSIGLTVKGVESTLLRLIRLVQEKLDSRPRPPKPDAPPESSDDSDESPGDS
jgi:RNA polymerase sigma-70 factor (ECF subfamily)